jgi:hypothetical protein
MMKTPKSLQEDVMMKGMKSFGIFGIIMVALTLLVMRLFFMDTNAQSMEEKKQKVIREDEEFNTAMQDCLASVETDEKGRPDLDALGECMTEKGFPPPEMEPGSMGPGGKALKGPAGFMPPPPPRGRYEGTDDEHYDQ